VGNVAKAIGAKYGSFDEFKTKFAAAGMAGSVPDGRG